VLLFVFALLLWLFPSAVMNPGGLVLMLCVEGMDSDTQAVIAAQCRCFAQFKSKTSETAIPLTLCSPGVWRGMSVDDLQVLTGTHQKVSLV
jgi:hypothetical protein